MKATTPQVAAALEAVAATGFNIDFSNFIFLGAIKTTPTNRFDLETEIWIWEDGSGTFTSKEYRDNGLFNVIFFSRFILLSKNEKGYT